MTKKMNPSFLPNKKMVKQEFFVPLQSIYQHDK